MAGELSRRGYVASITLRNTRGIDILVSNADATKGVGIQVKTNQGREKKWILNARAEKDTAANLFYVFVRLNHLNAPEYHVVPRADVAKYVSEDHKQWLSSAEMSLMSAPIAPGEQPNLSVNAWITTGVKETP